MTNISLRQNGVHFNRYNTFNPETMTHHLNDVIAELESIRKANTRLLSDLSHTLHRLETLKTPRLVNDLPRVQIA